MNSVKYVTGRLLGLVLSALLSSHNAFPETLPNKPNIIVIMADDLDVNSLDAVLSVPGLMKNFKTYFINQGIKFKESFVTNALCCPSRSTYLSGKYTHNHQTYTNGTFNGTVINFDDTTAMPTWLQTAGYRTVHVGKYLNMYGSLSELSNNNLGKEEKQVILLQALQIQQTNPTGFEKLKPTYVPPGWSEWYGLLDYSTYCTYNYSINENKHIKQYLKNGQILKDGVEIQPAINDGKQHHYQTDVLAEYAKAVIQNNTDKPLFLSIMPLAPHVEKCENYDPTGPALKLDQYKDQFQFYIRPADRHLPYVSALQDLGKYWLPMKSSFNYLDPGKPSEFQQKLVPLNQDPDLKGLYRQYGNRLASLLAMDDLIGTVVTALGDQLDNTIIFFTADNGWFYGEHELSGKVLAYEEAVRVPLYVRLPQGGGSRQINRIALNNDLAPTIAELAQAQPTHIVDGRSLVPLLNNSAISWRKQFLVEHYLGTWSEDIQQRLLDWLNLFAVRTGLESSIPQRLYAEHYDGMQTKNGYYLHKGDQQPGGELVWRGPVIDKEYYNMTKDPLQIDNLLYQLNSRPNKSIILLETVKMKNWLNQLLLCVGISCKQVEDQ